MYKRIFSVLLIALICFSCAGCKEKDNYISVKLNTVSGYKAFGNSGALKFNNTEGLIKAAENQYIELYYSDKTYVLTAFDKRTGKSYTTASPTEVPDKSNSALAMLNLTYSDTQGKNKSIDSYTQSVLLEQVKVQKAEKAITFTYSIGDISDGLEVTPTVISNERFEAILEKSNSSQKKTLERRYSYVKETDSWARRKIANPKAIEELVKAFKDLGYTAEDLARDNAENGVANSAEQKVHFVVPLTFTLDKDSVIASIDLQKVEYPSKHPLIQIELLQFFGAATGNEKGYFLLPDGSGALMEFKKVQGGADSYAASVYGEDKAMRSQASAAVPQDIYMPIFGAHYDNGGFLAVIEDGDALSDILAYNSGAADEYNKIYSRLDFLKSESVALGNNSASDNFNYFNFQDESYKGNYTVRYILLENNKSDYIGMAESYRNYLTSTGLMPDRNSGKNAPFVLETIGGILSDKSFLGFQYQGITELTEYEENAEMVETLKKNGVENVSLRLSAFYGDGLQNLLPTKVKLIGNLGGKKGMEQLKATSDKLGFKLYPDFEYLTFSANSGLVTKNKYAIISMDYKAVQINVLNPVTLKQNTQLNDNRYYLTAISKLDNVNNGVKKYLNSYGIKQLSIADMAKGVSSDFTSSASYDRQSATNYTSEMLKKLSGEYDLMLSGANARNVKYATLVTDAPIWSSQYNFTEGVPFYSIVYHGLTDYTGSAINLASDKTTEFLRCIEYGASLKYTLIYKNKSVVKNSDYTYLYSAGFKENVETASESYKSVNIIYKKVSDEYIVGHKSIGNSVYLTEYSNGICTIVNYSNNDYTSQYGVVPARDYIVVGEV